MKSKEDELLGLSNIPADVILIETYSMKVLRRDIGDNEKENPCDIVKKIKNIFLSHNVALFGSTCTEGSGVCMVFRTGKNTIISKIGEDIEYRSDLY